MRLVSLVPNRLVSFGKRASHEAADDSRPRCDLARFVRVLGEPIRSRCASDADPDERYHPRTVRNSPGGNAVTDFKIGLFPVYFVCLW